MFIHHTYACIYWLYLHWDQKEVLPDLSRLMRGDFNPQIRYLAETERHAGGHLSLPADRTCNDDRLVQVCSDRGRLQVNTNFVKKWRRLTWHPSSPSLHWTLLDYTIIGHRWAWIPSGPKTCHRGLSSAVEDCWLFRFTPWTEIVFGSWPL